MTASAKQQPRTAQRLTVVVAVIRWNRGGAGGLCADCHRQAPPDAMPRSVVHAYATPPPEQLVRLSMVAPGTRAESAQVDSWMREQMQKQTHPRRQSAVVSRAICFSCAIQMLNSYLKTDAGTLTGALAAITDDLWSALFMTCQSGFGRTLDRYAFNGRGAVPAVVDLLDAAATMSA